MVDETLKRRNAETQKPDRGSDCQLSVANCQLTDGPARNRESPIDNPRTAAVWHALETVTDPEIPVLSVVDMGIIADIRIFDLGVTIDMTPTFAGCPAVDVIRSDIRSAVQAAGEVNVTVNVVFDPPWTSDRLTEAGRRKLEAFGVAPPQSKRCGASSMPALDDVACPHCRSMETDLESLFGPTLCRSIHYCRACRQSFEHFKQV